MTDDRAAGFPTVVLCALPVISLLTFYGVISLPYNVFVTAVLGFTCGATLVAELMILPAALFSFIRYPHLRSWPQVGGLSVMAGHLLLIFVAPFFAGGI